MKRDRGRKAIQEIDLGRIDLENLLFCPYGIEVQEMGQQKYGAGYCRQRCGPGAVRSEVDRLQQSVTCSGLYKEWMRQKFDG